MKSSRAKKNFCFCHTISSVCALNFSCQLTSLLQVDAQSFGGQIPKAQCHKPRLGNEAESVKFSLFRKYFLASASLLLIGLVTWHSSPTLSEIPARCSQEVVPKQEMVAPGEDFGSLLLSGVNGSEHIKLSLLGSTLTLQINSTRRQCRINFEEPSEACVFRVYLTSAAFTSGDFCSPIKFSNGTYHCSLRALENHFNVLIVFESYANTSNHGLATNPGWGTFEFNTTHQSVGQAVLNQEVQIGTEKRNFSIPSTKHLKLCSFQEANIAGSFLWHPLSF